MSGFIRYLQKVPGLCLKTHYNLKEINELWNEEYNINFVEQLFDLQIDEKILKFVGIPTKGVHFEALLKFALH